MSDKELKFGGVPMRRGPVNFGWDRLVERLASDDAAAVVLEPGDGTK